MPETVRLVSEHAAPIVVIVKIGVSVAAIILCSVNGFGVVSRLTLALAKHKEED